MTERSTPGADFFRILAIEIAICNEHCVALTALFVDALTTDERTKQRFVTMKRSELQALIGHYYSPALLKVFRDVLWSWIVANNPTPTMVPRLPNEQELKTLYESLVKDFAEEFAKILAGEA